MELENEPRWPAVVAVIAVAALQAAVPPSLSAGPSWLLPSIIVPLLAATIIARRTHHATLNAAFGITLNVVMTLFLVWSLALLVLALPQHTQSPGQLLRSAGALWATNVLVFALWYWRLDAGGPHARDQRRTEGGHREGTFLFPQMTLDSEMLVQLGEERWSPQFVDYLFLAFNTSTALSPADTSALSRWAKVLMMIQASISLATIALLAARGVNIL